MKKSRLFIISSTLILSILLSNQALACGPFLSSYIYDVEDINSYYPPDYKKFLDSNYDIILSDWGPEFLYPVYRELAGRALSEETKEDLLLLYLGKYYVPIEYGPPYGGFETVDNPILAWEEARKLVRSEEVNISPYKQIDQWQYSLNCLPDAFKTATETLKNRINVYNDSQMKEWLRGQDRVFAECGGAGPMGFIPRNNFSEGCGDYVLSAVDNSYSNDSYNTASVSDAAEGLISFLSDIWHSIFDGFSYVFTSIAHLFTGNDKREISKPQEDAVVKNGSDKLLEYDLAYQDAAAEFYKWDLNEAEARFSDIANNEENQWSDISKLVLARVYIRQENYDKAKVELETILNNDSLSSLHDGARSLLGFVNFRKNPEQRLKDAEEILLTSDTPDEIINNLEDFTLLWYRNLYEKWFYATKSKYNYRNTTLDENFDKYEQFVLNELGDFAKWLYVWWSPRGDHLDWALDEYSKSQSLPWLLASLRHMESNHPMKTKIMNAALGLKKNSPAYLTSRYYYYKLLFEENSAFSGSKELDNFTAEINASTTPIAYNYFSDLRMRYSDDLEDALRFSLRKIVGIYYAYESGGIQPISEYYANAWFLDNKMKRVFNELLPLSKWSEIAESEDTILNRDAMHLIRAATFTRAIILENYDIADKMAKLLSLYSDALKKDLAGYLEAKSGDEKKFTASLFMLKYWGVSNMLTESMDSALSNTSYFKTGGLLRENWWCDFNAASDDHGLGYYDVSVLENLVSNKDKIRAKIELKAMAPLIGSNYLTANVIYYAKKYSKDERVPEALHRAVKSTRYTGCKSAETTEFSRQAFQLLHKNYPTSVWAKSTPYWY